MQIRYKLPALLAGLLGGMVIAHEVYAQAPAADNTAPTLRYLRRPSHPLTPDALGAAAPVPSLPLWQGSDGAYTYRMVGTDPAAAGSNGTTTIQTNIIPVILTFSDGTILDPTAASGCSASQSAESLVLSSPLFNNSAYTPGGVDSGSTQYIDFFQRANFWQFTAPAGINPNYHILLAAAPVAPVGITVPAASGHTTAIDCGRQGHVDVNWFDDYIVASVFPQLAAAGVAPNTLPAFILLNTVLYDPAEPCCFAGYHSAFSNPGFSNALQTYAVADFDTSGQFGSIQDVAALAHEMGEWLDDPAVNNTTPAWGHTAGISGCHTDLEPGDPLSTGITVTMSNAYTYHLQELAFKSWFFRDVPSTGVNGWYSSNGTLSSPSTPCGTSTTRLTISPASISAGSTANVNVTVTGSTSDSPSGQVTLVSSAGGATLGTLTLASGGTASAAIAFPAGSYRVTAKYAGDSNFTPSLSSPVALTVGSPSAGLNPASLAFAGQNTGTSSAAQNATLTSQGATTLSIGSISVTGVNAADFSQTNNCPASLAAGATCTISVTFRPVAAGARNAAVSIVDNATGSPQSIALSGTGISAVAATASAVFLKADAATQGNWRSAYGADGYNVIGDVASNPSYASPVISGASIYTWDRSPNDVRALQKASSPPNRIAGTWYSGTVFTVDLNTTDQLPHQLALYCLDWDTTSRQQIVEMLDMNGNVLNTQTLTGFHGGIYLVWNITGQVKLRVTNLGANAVVSGLFFGGPSGAGGAGATFIKADTTTQGSWRLAYGADGYSVLGDLARNPSYASPVFAGATLYTWNGSTSDVRALQKASNPLDRIAGTTYTGTAFTIDLNMTDSLPHQVALYCLDWDTASRQQTVDLLDANGNVLNTQALTGFQGGVYLVWSITGHVKLHISNAGVNAVVSGLFFGSAAAPAAATVTFVKTDTATEGSWRGVYGSDGYSVAGDLSSNPSYASPVFTGATSYTWGASTRNVRALQKPSDPADRIAATWYSNSVFTIDLNTTDQLQHQLALYCLDWDTSSRQQTVDVLDVNGNVLNTQTVTGFHEGVYLVWNIAGKVKLRITNVGANAVLSGLFFQ